MNSLRPCDPHVSPQLLMQLQYFWPLSLVPKPWQTTAWPPSYASVSVTV